MSRRQDGWAAFKEVARDRLILQAGIQAVEAALARLREVHGPDLLSIIVFGSFARASQNYDDIDLLIVTRQPWGPVHQVTHRLSHDVFGPLFLEHGQLFSFLVYDQNQLQRLQDHLPLFAAVRKDGILLYGKDPFTKTTGQSLPENRSSPVGHG